jgi:hypothetical protein
MRPTTSPGVTLARGARAARLARRRSPANVRCPSASRARASVGPGEGGAEERVRQVSMASPPARASQAGDRYPPSTSGNGATSFCGRRGALRPAAIHGVPAGAERRRQVQGPPAADGRVQRARHHDLDARPTALHRGAERLRPRPKNAGLITATSIASRCRASWTSARSERDSSSAMRTPVAVRRRAQVATSRLGCSMNAGPTIGEAADGLERGLPAVRPVRVEAELDSGPHRALGWPVEAREIGVHGDRTDLDLERREPLRHGRTRGLGRVHERVNRNPVRSGRVRRRGRAAAGRRLRPSRSTAPPD